MKTVRWLKPGDMFVLRRTGEKYQYVKRDINTPGGIKHWVMRFADHRLTTLHHSCHVELSETYAISILQAGVLALTRINVKDGRIEELKRAIAILEQNR
jgi:hypothetical protein